MYDFETHTPALGLPHPMWDSIKAHGITEDGAICYGVAEMKFPLAPAISKALHDFVDTGYFGYVRTNQQAIDAFCAFAKRIHSLEVPTRWVTLSYGVVSAIAMAIRALSSEGDGVIIQTPVYNPFHDEVVYNRRVCVENPLIRTGDRYEIDFEDLERKAADPNNKLMILCTPHNPVGRVWTREELHKVSQICLANGVTVIADEIHNDLDFTGAHTPYAAISDEAAQNCVMCCAPSKTFNIPGLITSAIVIPNDTMRGKFNDELRRCCGGFLNPVGIAASVAAWTDCDEWLEELLHYLEGNAEYLRSLLAEKLPRAWMPKMEGTYLAWIDMSFLGMDDDALERFIIDKAQLYVNMGRVYGHGGEGFIRVNIGCPRKFLDIFVGKLAEAVSAL